MANRRVKINVDLDFTSDQMSLDKIRDQIDAAIEAVEINLDPKSAEKFKKDLGELGNYLEKHLNESAGKINAKNLLNDLSNSSDLKALKDLGPELAQVGVHGSQTFNRMTMESNYLNKSLTESNSILSRMGTTLMNTIRWNISASAVNAVTGEFQKMYFFAKDLDRALTNIRIVSGLSVENMERFAASANRAAKELKVSTIDYTEAALIFYQQGMTALEVTKMTDASIIGANITGESTAEVADLLTASMNGFKLQADEVFNVVDKLAAVGATTAANFYELATGFSKVASMANAAGVTLDSLNAQLSTIVSVTRESPESIGMSLKTIYGRMLMFKTDVDALMKDDEGEVFGAPNVEAAMQAFNKVSGAQLTLFRQGADGSRQLKPLQEVIEDIGDAWDTTNDKTAKFGLATALAGSRQQNRLIALFDSWEMYREAVETSLNSEGTALRQNEIYLDSYEGRLKGLQAAKEELYMTMIESDSMKGFISGITRAVEMFTQLSEAAGGFNLIIAGIGVLFSQSIAKKGTELFTGIDQALRSQRKVVDQELKATQQLDKINKVYGAEEANRLRRTLNLKKELLQQSKIENDLLAEKHTLTTRIGEIVDSSEGAAQEGRLNTLMQEYAHLEMSEEKVRSIQEEYQLLKLAEQELHDLRVRASEGGATKNLDVAIQKASQEVDKLKMDVDHTLALIEDRKYDSDKVVDFRTREAEKPSKEINKQYNEAQKVLRVTDLIRTASMAIPVGIKLATDESATFGDTLSGIGKATVPMLLSGLMKAAPAMIAAAKGATGFGAAMAAAGGAVLPIIGPIVAIGAGVAAIALTIKAISNATVTFAKSMQELEKASEELEAQEKAYSDIEEQLAQIEERRRAIDEIGKDDTTTEEVRQDLEEELRLLDIKYTRLEQELVIEEMLLQVAREKAELAAQEAAEATMKSDYSTTMDPRGHEHRDQVTVAEELKLAADAYVEADAKALEYRRTLAELESAEGSTAREIKKAQKNLDDATEAREKASEHVSEYSIQIRDIIANLEDEEGANNELIKTLEEYLDISTDAVATTLNLGDAFDEASPDELNEGLYETVDQMDLLIESYEEIADRISMYDSFLEELNSEEGLSIANRDLIITKHQELMPYLDDEAAMRDFLIEKIKEEEEAQRQAYINMIMYSEEYFDAKIKGTGILTEKLGEYYDADLENAKNLATAKAQVEANLINNLASQWAKFYRVDTTGEILQTVGQGGLIDEAGRNMADHIRMERDKIAGMFDEIAVSTNIPDFSGISRARSATPSRSGGGSGSRSGSGRKGSGSKAAASSAEKEQYRAEAELYAQINQELERNNVLLSINKAAQDLASDDLEKKIALMREEIAYNERRQELLNQLNIERRERGKQLQSELAGIFDFDGSWEDNTIMITNLDAISGKSKEIEEKYKEILSIMSDLPGASQEWLNIQANNKKIAEDITKTLEEQVSDRVSGSKWWIEHRNFYDDWADYKQAGDEGLADNEIAAWKRIKDYIEQYYADGKISHKSYKDYILEADKALASARQKIADEEKAQHDERMREYERERDAWVTARNEELQDRRDRLNALESIQEAIVQIVRKRGEEEQKALDKAHRNEMDSLEKRHNKRRDAYREELDEFNKMIQGKIDALTEQHEEEDYEEDLEKRRQEAIELQRQIDVLSLDDSLEARNKKIKLEEELAKKNEEIAKMQQRRERKLLINSLRDQMKDKEKDVREREGIADDLYENERKRLEEEYEINKEYLDRKYSDEQVYAEARESIMRGTVEVTKGHFVDIYEAYQDFEDKFGRGMGILGNIIKQDFLSQLEQAEKALRRMEYLERARDDYTADDYPVRPPRDPRDDRDDRDKGSGRDKGMWKHHAFSNWSDKDYTDYINNKKAWEKATSNYGQDGRYVLENRNLLLRMKYGMEADKHHWKDLVKGSYSKGGKIDFDGLINVHGKDNPEWVMRDHHINDITQRAVFSALKIALPDADEFGQKPSFQIDKLIEIQGNVDREVMPELKKAGNDISDAIKKLNKNGVFRPIKIK